MVSVAVLRTPAPVTVATSSVVSIHCVDSVASTEGLMFTVLGQITNHISQINSQIFTFVFDSRQYKDNCVIL